MILFSGNSLDNYQATDFISQKFYRKLTRFGQMLNITKIINLGKYLKTTGNTVKKQSHVALKLEQV